MYELKEVKIDEIKNMLEKSYKMLIAPKDDFWEEGILPDCKYFTISNENNPIGYFAIGEGNTLYQFYIDEKNTVKSGDIFNFVKDKMGIFQAIVESYDINFLIHCLDHAREIAVHSYAYTQWEKLMVESPIDKIQVKLATMDDLSDIVKSTHISLDGADEDWLSKYYKRWIVNKGIYLFMYGNEIAAIGEIRTGLRSEKTAYLGIVVSKEYRKIGMGQYVTCYIRNKANELGFTAASSVDANNIGSNKMMKKSGFFPHHRILYIKF